METTELLARAQEIADWYQEKDIMIDEDGRPYVVVDYEDDECRVEFKKRYLDY